MSGFLKIGENLSIQSKDILPPSYAAVHENSQILEKFAETAKELKKVAPKANDFLYFSAIMMHSAEASLLDEQGKLRKNADGSEVSARWEEKGESLKWVCSDKNIQPYRNSNHDIFPESQLILAHKNWVGKPLCLDHKSSSVDHIRGIIVDTYYDFPMKRVIALCALDQVNYPDLARKVKTGYSRDVSMGTAVEKAICYDCGKVARAEPDFCDHMRNKSCYGEINVGLKPIELSIVVNGADQRAKIRHIIAAAKGIENYLQKKLAFDPEKALEEEKIDVAIIERVLNKLKELDKDIASLEISEERKKSLDEILQKLEQDLEQLGDREQEEVREYQAEAQKPKEAQNFTRQENLKFAQVIDDLQGNLSKLHKSLERIEEKMSEKKAYMQGTVEPTPGRPQYAKEEGPDEIRNKYDKHMESPQDVGSVTGLFPGDEQKKRELHRLAKEQEERKLRRLAALEKAKQAYVQGTEEPTPGKPKYPKEDADKIRDKEDKHMQGASPFPGVGKVDGLYGDDLKKKEMINRANTKLKGKFITAANSDGTENKAESRWDVYAQVGEKSKLVFSATVNQLTNGKAEVLYDQVHDEKFGKKILATIRSEGFEKANLIFKGAQAAPQMPQMPQLDLGGGAPAAGPAMPSAPMPGAEMPEMGGMDAGGTGDPKKQLPELLDQAEGTLADIRKGVDALTGESGNELSEVTDMAPPAEAPVVAEMLEMRQKLVQGIKTAMIQNGKQLKSAIGDLKIAKEIYQEGKLSKEQAANLNGLAKSSMKKTRQLIVEAHDLMKSFIRLAQGTQLIEKKAKEYSRMKKQAQEFNAGTYDAFSPEAQFGTSSKPSGSGYVDKSKPAPMAPPKKAPKGLPKVNDKSTFDEMYRARGKGREQLDKTLQQTGTPGAYSATPKPTKPTPGVIDISADTVAPQDPYAVRMPGPSYPKPEDKHTYEDPPATFDKKDPRGRWNAGDFVIDAPMNVDDEDLNDAVKINDKGELIGDTPEEVGKAHKAMKSASEEFDLTTKEGRAAKRLKLAEKGLKWSEWASKANPKGVTPEMDRKPAGDLAKIEVPTETHAEMLKMVDLHKTTPPKAVQKQAAQIQEAVKSGKIAADEVESLIAHGVDADAVKYWKQYYGQAKDGGSEFAAELVKEHEKAKKAEEIGTMQTKFARAYEFAHELALRGQIENSPASIRKQAEDITKWNDEAFNSMQNFLARTPVVKQASIPEVGVSESVLGINSLQSLASEAAPIDLVGKFERALMSRKKR